MKYTITHKTQYTYSHPVPLCHNKVFLKPRQLPQQTCDTFRLVIQPEPNDLSSQTDHRGNETAYFSIEQAHLGLSVTAISNVEVSPTNPSNVSPAWNELVDQLQSDDSVEWFSAREYAYASERARPLVQLTEYAQQSFPEGRPVMYAAKDLTNRIFSEFEYDPRATTVSTPIGEVFQSRRGVCQDFAHLQLACLRGLGLAARYVSGYLRTIPPPGQQRLVGADASHAWISVFCGDHGWVDFDPTNNIIPTQNHVTLAWGRDYNDVMPVRGVILGGGTYQMEVSVDVAPYEPTS